jgi:hypothetical protein
MANVFVEEHQNGWVALQNRQPICYGRTQAEAGDTAHNIRPNDTVFGERVRDTEVGTRDKWRVLHHPASD